MKIEETNNQINQIGVFIHLFIKVFIHFPENHSVHIKTVLVIKSISIKDLETEHKRLKQSSKLLEYFYQFKGHFK